jgi:phosphatidylserine/phosphatidylglycerophosphate/cardiolipin synthase-like enzyme
LGSYNTNYKNIDLEVFVWNEGKTADSSLYQVKDYFDAVWKLSYCKDFRYPAKFRGSEKSKETATMLADRLDTLHSSYAKVLNTADSTENTLPAGKIQLISNPIHRGNKEPYVWNTLYKLMDSAKERVYLHTPYIICSKDMYEGLNRIGHKDIETKLLLNAPEIGANPFGCSDYLSEKSKVLATGFSVYEYMGAHSSYHTKAILIDDNLSIVGSYNTDMRSTYLDTELMLSIEGAEFNAALEMVMNEAESQCKHTISEDDYTIPDNITEAAFDDKERRKYKFIILLTRPIRFLL